MVGKVKKLLLFILMCMLFNINLVKAEGCNTEEINRLKELSENIFVDVDFNYEAAEAGLINSNYVTIQGLPNELYIYTDDLSVLFTSDQQDESGMITRIVKDGVTKLNVYSNTCPNEIIRTIKLTLNTYNPYSKYEECEGIDGNDLDVCDEFYDKNISEEQFLEEVEKYKEVTKSNNILKDENKILKILIPIIGALVIILIIVVIRKKIKDNRLD